MITLVLLLCAAQGSAWTVTPPEVTIGDTVHLTRQVIAAPGVVPHVTAIGSSATLEPLDDPVIGYAEGRVLVRFTLAFFEPGEHAVVMPDMELSYPDGHVEHIAGDTAWVSVRSVLPAADSAIAPKPSLGPLARRQQRAWIVAVLASLVVIAMGIWGHARLRVAERPVWHGRRGKFGYPPIEQWIQAGELRAAVSAVTDVVRSRIEQGLPQARRQLSTAECLETIEAERPDWPIRALRDVLHSLDRAQFAPAVPSDVVELAARADELLQSLPAGPAGEGDT